MKKISKAYAMLGVIKRNFIPVDRTTFALYANGKDL